MRAVLPLTLLLLLLALAFPGAHAQAELSLTVDPAEQHARPGSDVRVTLAIANPTADTLTLALKARSATGATVTFDETTVQLAPRSRSTFGATIHVPEALNVTHTLTLGALETGDSAKLAGRATPLSAEATARLLAGAPSAALPIPPPAQIMLRVEPVRIEIAPHGEASATLVVINAGTDPVPLELEIVQPAGVRVTLGQHPPRIEPGARFAIPIRFAHEGADAPAGGLQGAFGMRDARIPFATYDIAFVAAPPEPAAEPDRSLMTAVALGGAAAIWTSAWLTRRHWWPILGLLYTRLRPSKMLDHPVRKRIVEIVRLQPGISFSELARAVGIAPGQLTHHARMLEKAGIVFSSPDGQTRRFFHVAAGRLPATPPLGERIVSHLVERPRIASELARDLGVSRQAVHYHVKQLVAQGQLIAKARGRELWLEATQQPSSASTGLARS